MYEVHVKIALKKGVSDPEGANTLKALHLLGYETVTEAKIIRTVVLTLDEPNKDTVQQQVKQMCQRLLTNPVIHHFDISITRKE